MPANFSEKLKSYTKIWIQQFVSPLDAGWLYGANSEAVKQISLEPLMDQVLASVLLVFAAYARQET